MILVAISATVLPLDFAFGIGRTPQAFALFVALDVAFVADFVIHFRLAFASSGSLLLIRQPSLIFKRSSSALLVAVALSLYPHP